MLDFGTCGLGKKGVSKTATLSNPASNHATADITGIVISGSTDFSITATTCGATLAAGSSCSITVVFNPSPRARSTASCSSKTTAATRHRSSSSTAADSDHPERSKLIDALDERAETRATGSHAQTTMRSSFSAACGVNMTIAALTKS